MAGQVGQQPKQGAGGDHQHTVRHAVHADQRRPAVTGDGVVEPLHRVQAPDADRRLHQHRSGQAAPGRPRPSQKHAAPAHQRTQAVQRAQFPGMQPPRQRRARHGRRRCQQRRDKQPGGVPPQCDQPLLHKHGRQVTGQRDGGIRSDQPHRQGRCAQHGGTFSHMGAQPGGQVSKWAALPRGLFVGNKRLLQSQRRQQRAKADAGIGQIKPGKPQHAGQYTCQRTQRRGQPLQNRHGCVDLQILAFAPGSF